LDLVGWICTYTPEEIIRAAGFLPYRLLPYNPEDSAGDRDLLPPALCPYVRQAARSICRRSNENLRGLVIANSCSAAIHLYNTFAGRDELFVHLLDLPRLQTAESVLLGCSAPGRKRERARSMTASDCPFIAAPRFRGVCLCGRRVLVRARV